MRPIRRFGPTNLISERLSIKNRDKISSSFNRSSWTSTVEDDRRKLHHLVSNNHVTERQSDKENRRIEQINSINNEKQPEVIISTPAFQLVCDRRRTQTRHASADEAVPPAPPSIENHKQPKSAMKKAPQNGLAHRSRWTAFGHRSVSFADDKGLQLVDIRLIDLAISDDQYGSLTAFSPMGRQASGFIADFILPPAYRRLRALQCTDTTPPLASSQIVLESYSSTRWSVTGIIAVRGTNGAVGEKRVFVRYTNDHWTTSMDNEGVLTPPEAGSKIDISNSPIEKYNFTLPFPLRPQTGSRLEFKFGVRMPAGVGGVLSPITYWDDNHGANYSFTFV